MWEEKIQWNNESKYGPKGNCGYSGGGDVLNSVMEGGILGGTWK